MTTDSLKLYICLVRYHVAFPQDRHVHILLEVIFACHLGTPA
jgi:hypothetical protein